nr:DUF4328 domain-containing protein [Parvularcula dongshanensis]
MGALLVQLVLHAFTFACEVLAPGLVLPQPGGGRTALGHAYLASFFTFAVAIPLGCFTWMRWLDWSVKNLAAEGRAFPRTPAQVVWAYFIPGVNLYQPPRDLEALWRAQRRAAVPPPAVLPVWWGITLAHLALMLFDVQDGITILTVTSSALGVLGQVLALVLLRLFAQRQRHSGIEPRPRRLQEGASMAPEPEYDA